MLWISQLILGLLWVAAGGILGSFAVAQVWRLRAKELAERKRAKEDYSPQEYQRLVTKSKLNQTKIATDRSRCLECGYQLRWFDLIPIISWLSLRGRCRKCQAKIGRTEVIAEIVLAALFGFSWWFWSVNYDLGNWLYTGLFLVWLGLLVYLAVFFIYDFHWQLLPSIYLYAAIAWAVVFALMSSYLAVSQFGWEIVDQLLVDYLLAVVILAGVYAVINLISRGQWIGSGDVFLGVVLALILGEPLLAFIGLFLANLIGTALVLPGFISGKISAKTRLAMGPLLIVGGLIAFFCGQQLIKFFWFG